MSDTIITIIAIFLAAVLMFLFPVLNIAVENDKIAQTAVETLVTDYTNLISKKGKITLEDYENFITKLYATGNSYDVSIEAKILDENLTKLDDKASAKYYSVFTESIFNDMDKKTKEYYLKEGDLISVTANNNNITIGTQLKNLFYKVTGNNVGEIYANCILPVTENGINSVNIAGTLSDGEYPVQVYENINVEVANTKYKACNFIFCLDTSVSMGNNSTGATTSSELEAAKATVIERIEKENLDKNTVTIIAFSDYAKKIVDSLETNSKDEIIAKVRSINSNTTFINYGDTYYNKLMNEITKILDNLNNNNIPIVVIFTDGLTSDGVGGTPGIQDPKNTIGQKIALDNVVSFIYNLKNNWEIFLPMRYAGKEHLAIKVHPQITMGIFSGQVEYERVFYTDRNKSEENLAYLNDLVENAETKLKNSIDVATGDEWEFSEKLKEVIKDIQNLGRWCIGKPSTVNKKLTLQTEKMDLSKNIKIIIGESEEESFTRDSLPQSVVLNEAQGTITIDFSFYEITDDLIDKIKVEYESNVESLVSY